MDIPLTASAAFGGVVGHGDDDVARWCAEPAERMDVDELRATQLAWLQWSLRHAYDNVVHHRRAFDAAGVHPDNSSARRAAGHGTGCPTS